MQAAAYLVLAAIAAVSACCLAQEVECVPTTVLAVAGLQLELLLLKGLSYSGSASCLGPFGEYLQKRSSILNRLQSSQRLS